MRLADPLAIVGVDDEDESLGVLEVVAPQRADLVLAADVPHGEADVLVLDGLHVESFKTNIMYWSLDTCIHFTKTNTTLTDGWDRRDDLAELQLVQDGCLSCGVESHCKFE